MSNCICVLIGRRARYCSFIHRGGVLLADVSGEWRAVVKSGKVNQYGDCIFVAVGA